MWLYNVLIVGFKKCVFEVMLIGEIWWIVGDIGVNYNEL